MKRYNYGLFAEYYMIFQLYIRGYRILARRYKTSLGEIDIIAKRNRNLVAFEVKARKNGEFTTELVRKKQLKRIENAMKIFLSENDVYIDYNILFGIIFFRNIFRFKIFIGTD
ncbi:MAG: YraN family protein [Rickettsiales bacterium]|jgi:putative endonuclease|nr:YraN family protein [Rickettsiales bacterium]